MLSYYRFCFRELNKYFVNECFTCKFIRYLACRSEFISNVNNTQLNLPAILCATKFYVPLCLNLRNYHLFRISSSAPGHRNSRGFSNQQSGNSEKKQNENPDDKDENESSFSKFLIFIFGLYIIFSYFSVLKKKDMLLEHRNVSWNEFVNRMLVKGEVQKLIVDSQSNRVLIILHPNAIYNGKIVEEIAYYMDVLDIGQFEERLREAENNIGIRVEDRVPVVYKRVLETISNLVPLFLALALIALSYSQRKNTMSPFKLSNLTSFTRAKFTLVDSLAGEGRGVTFNDVAGLHEAKLEIIEFVDYLKKPDYYRNLGAKIPKGALMLGPPGCGKTLLAKAVATECQVPFLTMNGSEFIEMIGGLGAARVRDLFREARKRSPCIVYIDEIDAIGRKRNESDSLSSGSSSEMEQTLNQLLVEMDGISTKGGVIVLASTNRSEVLDSALLRPGRFDRQINIDLPNLIERKEIFDLHLSSIVLDKDPSKYSGKLAQLTPGFSGADIMNVCNESALKAARDGQKCISEGDLEYAVERVVGGIEKRTQAISPSERKMIAYHESGHTVVGWMLQHTDPLLKVTIVPRTNHTLGFAQYKPSDQKLYTTEQLFDRMCVALGGKAAEAIVFNTMTTGAKNDLTNVTQSAYDQIRKYGMSSHLGPVYYDSAEYLVRPYSRQTAAHIDHEVRLLVARAYQQADRVLRENRHKLDLLAQTLLLRDSLSYQEIVQLIGLPRNNSSQDISLD